MLLMTQTPLKRTTCLKIVQVLCFQLLSLRVRHGLVPVVGPRDKKVIASWLLLLLSMRRLRDRPRLRDRASGPSSKGLEVSNIFLQDLMHTHQVSSETDPMRVPALALGTGESVVGAPDTSRRGSVYHGFFHHQLVGPLQVLPQMGPLGKFVMTSGTS